MYVTTVAVSVAHSITLVLKDSPRVPAAGASCCRSTRAPAAVSMKIVARASGRGSVATCRIVLVSAPLPEAGLQGDHSSWPSRLLSPFPPCAPPVVLIAPIPSRRAYMPLVLPTALCVSHGGRRASNSRHGSKHKALGAELRGQPDPRANSEIGLEVKEVQI